MHFKKVFTNREGRRYCRKIVKIMVLAVLASGIYTKPVLANGTKATLEEFLPDSASEESSSLFYLGDLVIEEDEVSIEEKMLTIKKECEEKEQREEERKAQIEARKREFVRQTAKIKETAKAIAKAKAEEEARARAEAEAKAAAEAAERARQEAQRAEFAHVAHQVRILGLMIDAEAAKTDAERFAVGSVVLNRIRSPYKEFRRVNTITEVLYQVVAGYKQYDSRYTIPYVESGREPSPEAMRIAEGLINGTIECLPEYVIYQTTRWESWMEGKLARYEIPGTVQCFAYPLDYEEGCK